MPLASALLASAIVLASCGSDAGDDRQFANDPVTRAPATMTPTAGTATEPAATTAPMASPESLLRTRGAPHTLYTVTGEDLVSLTVRHKTGEVRPIALPDGQALIAFDGSPSGDRVAVVAGSGEGMSLLLFDREGESLQDPVPLLSGATPVASPVAGQDSGVAVTWSPQGRTVLVVTPEAIVNVPVGGEPEPIDLSGIGGTVRSATWSPQGTQIALLVVKENGSQRVVLLDREGTSREVAPMEANPGMAIERLQWLPDGSGMAYVRAPLIDGVPMNGQLFVYRFADPLPTLVATSGQGGPSASITAIAPSPDGRSIAYVIAIRDGDAWAFHSLWVRSLRQPVALEVPAEPTDFVSNIWWVDRGLAWDEHPGGGDARRIIVYLNDMDGPVVLFDGIEQAGASPVASPAGTPGATPIATPQATPAT